ncbi:MAG: hypothetical protein QG608_3108 [Actinomycetota bacterium]|nr:hypothetical protein [Actinomycetota bacterium]
MTEASLSVPLRLRVARVLTEVLAPLVVLMTVLLVAGVATAGWPRGLLLGSVGGAVGAGIPLTVLVAGLRTGRYGDRHVTRREERPLLMVIGLISVLTGIGSMAFLGAPRDLLIVMGALLLGVVITLVITLVWKVSAHAACAAGSAVILVNLFGPALLSAAVPVAAVGWSRVALGDHTRAQVIVGTALGVAVVTGTLIATG